MTGGCKPATSVAAGFEEGPEDAIPARLRRNFHVDS
jgi:hypothetical protein